MLPFLNFKSKQKKLPPRVFKNNTYIPELNSNKLEAIVINTTNFEINNGDFKTFVDLLSNVTQTTDIDCVICVNNDKYSSIELEVNILKNLFKSVIIYTINIPPQDDVYIRINTGNEFIPPDLKYGSASGPNIQFIKLIKYCEKYNTILLLETDCTLFENWFSKLNLYIEHCGGFLISGSTNDADDIIRPHENFSLFLHINGVALYKTCSKNLQTLISLLDEHIKHRVLWGFRFTAYDYMLSNMIIEEFDLNKKKNLSFWKIAYKYTIKNSLIVNLSSSKSDIPIDDVLKYHPNCIILHKKL